MFQFEIISPLRKFYKLIASPSPDSQPQDLEWLAAYEDIDLLLSYSDYGLNIFKEEGGPNLKTFKPAYFGIDHNIFKPLDRDKIRHKYSVPNDWLICSFIGRNQRRKLFLDLIDCLELLKTQDYELFKRTYFHFHTPILDLNPWKLPHWLLESGMGEKILFTYICAECHNTSLDLYRGVITYCKYCGKNSATTPTVAVGLSQGQMAELYNISDAYVQYATCLHPNSRILTQDGWRDISKIKVGQKVLTHNNNWKAVKSIWKNLNKGVQCKEISLYTDYEKLVLTENHKVLTYCREELKCKKNPKEYLRILEKRNKILPEPKFKEISKLQTNDLLVFPIDTNEIDIDKIDLSEFIDNCDYVFADTLKIKHGKTVPRFIKIDNKFCKLLGMFLANGNADINACKWCFNSHHSEKIRFCQDVLARFGKAYINKYKDRQAIDISFYSKPYSRFFQQFYTENGDKTIPNWVLLLPLEKQKYLLQGMFLGDGCYSNDIRKNNIKRNTSIYYTSSKSLSDNLKLILKRLNIYFNSHISNREKDNKKDGKNRKNGFRFELSGDIQNELYIKSEKGGVKTKYINNYHLVPIKSIKNYSYNGNVFDLEIENDHSYCTSVGIVHNCEGFGAPLAEAMSCGIPSFGTNYSAISDVLRLGKGTPVEVQRFFYELELNARRALPNNEDFINKLIKLLKLPRQMRQKIGFESHLAAKEHFNWDNNAQVWCEAIESLDLKDKLPWHQPYIEYKPNFNVPQNLTAKQFVNWVMDNIWCEPERKDSYFALNVIKNLTIGAISQNNKLKPFTADNFFNFSKKRIEDKIILEKIRTGQVSIPDNDCIRYSRIKEMTK